MAALGVGVWSGGIVSRDFEMDFLIAVEKEKGEWEKKRKGCGAGKGHEKGGSERGECSFCLRLIQLFFYFFFLERKGEISEQS